ncbi:hypothetical protein AVEN_121294-1 [Araneus ventricosus]|uniref:Uncharacterized protein n=1 Tax=Araneus ventricosus TaxID=182803 RepID=A0A4Y2HKL4_ARAVE|nr:hypothetical protein AVEN_121294-1 [Araneus ventricosus]
MLMKSRFPGDEDVVGVRTGHLRRDLRRHPLLRTRLHCQRTQDTAGGFFLFTFSALTGQLFRVVCAKKHAKELLRPTLAFGKIGMTRPPRQIIRAPWKFVRKTKKFLVNYFRINDWFYL